MDSTFYKYLFVVRIRLCVRLTIRNTYSNYIAYDKWIGPIESQSVPRYGEANEKYAKPKVTNRSEIA